MQHDVGDRLKALRAERGLTLARLSEATEISSSFLSLVEQGRSDITIGRLLRLADFFELDISEFVSNNGTPATTIEVLHPTAENVVRSEGGGVDTHVLASTTRWSLAPVLCLHEPGAGVFVESPFDRDVFLYVLRGTFEVALGDEQPVRLKRGDAALFRADQSHRVTNVSRGRGEMLAVSTPPG